MPSLTAMSSPFFSIVIPTYNRSQLLRRAISSFLVQNFKDFELVVSDNASNDDTAALVKTFHDSRVVYRRNECNIGFIANVREAILAARGQYVVTHGDDDVLLYDDGLSRLHDVIIKTSCGFVRLNYLSQGRDTQNIINAWINPIADSHLARQAAPIEVAKFLENLHPEFLSGLVFKNENIVSEDFIHSEIASWIKIIFRVARDHGAVFMARNYIVASWSVGEIAKVYMVDDRGRLFFENYLDCWTSELLSREESDGYRKSYFSTMRDGFIYIFPAIKYFTDTKNLIAYQKRLKTLYPAFERDLRFWFYYNIARLLPRNVLAIIRRHVLLIRPDGCCDLEKMVSLPEIERRFEELNNIKIS